MNSDDEVNIPLVDEINELLAKERTLMGLRVMEHQVEAEEWKKKYQTLVENIGSDKGVDGGNIRAYEVAADVAVMEETWQRDFERILYMQHQSDHPWCLDVSHIEIQSTQLKQIINFPKSHNFHGLSVLKLNHCKLRDIDGELVTSLFHLNGIQALDLSYNDLGREFHLSMMNDIQRRRVRLQYLMLQGNPELSQCNLENMVHHLSGYTWGVGVTLMDMGRVNSKNKKAPRPDHHGHSSKHSASGGENPHLSLRFLRNLNYVLDKAGTIAQAKQQSQQGSVGVRGRETNDAKDSGTKKRTSSSGATTRTASDGLEMIDPAYIHRGSGGAAGGPQLLAVLALTHAWLCKESIAQLQRSLEVTIGSLTDLDLTHSLLGYNGALMMGRVLTREACQLVRLNLTGNGIGDKGLADGLLQPLKNIQTLTYLNLQSNFLTDSSVRALGVALKRKQTLGVLLLDGNLITPDAAVFTQQHLLRSGAQVKLVWTPSVFQLSRGPSSAISDSRGVEVTMGRQTHSHLNSLYTVMGQLSSAVDPMTRSAHLYSIEAHHLRPLSLQYTAPSRLGLREEDQDPVALGTVVIRWDMGVRSHGTVGRRDHMRCSLAFEVRQKSGARSSVLCRRHLLANACLPIGSKTRCSASISTPPAGSTLELWAVVVASDSPIGTAADGNGLFVECSSLEVSRALIDLTEAEESTGESKGVEDIASSSSMVCAGGDAMCWSAALNGVVSTPDPLLSTDSNLIYSTSESVLLPDNFSVARKFRWIGQPLILAKVSFQARLCVATGGGGNSGAPVGDVEGHVGYVWRVLRCRHDCGVSAQQHYTVVAEGALNTWSGGEKPSANHLLAPWLWREVSTTVENVGMNDGFLVCCRVTRKGEEGAQQSLAVNVKDCKVLVESGGYSGWEDLLNEGDSTPTLLYSTFNDPSLQMAR